MSKTAEDSTLVYILGWLENNKLDEDPVKAVISLTRKIITVYEDNKANEPMVATPEYIELIRLRKLMQGLKIT